MVLNSQPCWPVSTICEPMQIEGAKNSVSLCQVLYGFVEDRYSAQGSGPTRALGTRTEGGFNR